MSYSQEKKTTYINNTITQSWNYQIKIFTHVHLTMLNTVKENMLTMSEKVWKFKILEVEIHLKNITDWAQEHNRDCISLLGLS